MTNTTITAATSSFQALQNELPLQKHDQKELSYLDPKAIFASLTDMDLAAKFIRLNNMDRFTSHKCLGNDKRMNNPILSTFKSASIHTPDTGTYRHLVLKYNITAIATRDEAGA